MTKNQAIKLYFEKSKIASEMINRLMKWDESMSLTEMARIFGCKYCSMPNMAKRYGLKYRFEGKGKYKI